MTKRSFPRGRPHKVTEGLDRKTRILCFHAIICVMYFVAGTVGLRAEYNYVTGDPITVQQSLISDLQSGHLDPTNLDLKVVQAIQQGAAFAPTSRQLNQLGAVTEVCLFFGVRSTSELKLSIRTVHQRGCADWVVTSSTAPEVVHGLVFTTRPKIAEPDRCGAPAVLMPPPIGSEAFVIPAQIDCKKDVGAVTRGASPGRH